MTHRSSAVATGYDAAVLRALWLASICIGCSAWAQQSPAPDVVALTSEELEQVPGIIGGPLSVLPLLPGAAPLLSPVAVSGIRGKQPSTLGVFYDGVELPTAFHLLAGPSVLQDAAVGRLLWNRSTPLTSRRGYVSGTFELSPPEGTPGLHAVASVDLLRAGVVGGTRSADGASRVLAGASVAWTPWLYTRVVPGESPAWDPSRASLRADLSDYLARGEHDFGRTTVRVLALGSVDQVASAKSAELIGVGLRFHRVDLRATREDVAGGSATAGVLVGHDALGAELGGAVAQTRAEVTHAQVGVRLSWQRALHGLGRMRFGAETTRRSAELGQRWTVRAPDVEGAAPTGPLEVGDRLRIADALVSGVWAEAELGSRAPWWVTAGVRIDDYHLFPGVDLLAVDPRVAGSYALGDRIEARAAVALLHQPPGFHFPLPGVDLAGLRFGLQEVLRINGGVTVHPWAHTALSLDVYVDPIVRSVELGPLDQDFLQTVKGSAEEVVAKKATRGQAHGVELSARRELEDGWFAFGGVSWQQSRRELRFPRRNDYGEPLEQASASLPVSWDHAVLASAAGGRTLGKWTFSAAAQFHSGAPEAGGLSSTTQREGLDRLRSGPKWIEQDLDRAGRLPPYFRLDVRVARELHVRPVRLVASLDVQNVTLSSEVTKFNYLEEAASLEDRAQGSLRLVRKPAGAGVPSWPLPMLGLTAIY